MSKREDPFDGAREVFAGIRSQIVAHAVATGFAEQPADVMRARAAEYMDTVTRVVVIPYVNRAILAAHKQGMPDREIEARVQDLMADLSAVVQDALRECGMDIQIQAFPIPARDGGRDAQG